MSLHGQDDYPTFWGSADEKGKGQGLGFNVNIPLPKGTRKEAYLQALENALVSHFVPYDPQVLVVSLGVDTYEHDPIGAFALDQSSYPEIGRLITKHMGHVPILFVMEGGYDLNTMGENVVAVLSG